MHQATTILTDFYDNGRCIRLSHRTVTKISGHSWGQLPLPLDLPLTNDSLNAVCTKHRVTISQIEHIPRLFH